MLRGHDGFLCFYLNQVKHLLSLPLSRETVTEHSLNVSQEDTTAFHLSIEVNFEVKLCSDVLFSIWLTPAEHSLNVSRKYTIVLACTSNQQ